jgi:hypothetical protein
MFDPANITVEDFKVYFYRDFSYLPLWSNASTYNAGKLVYYDITQLFYTCLNNGVTSIPTTTSDWSLNNPQQNIYDYVLDQDIQTALDETKARFNVGLIPATDSNATNVQTAFLYLAAHILAFNLSKLNGLSGSISYPVNSRAVGSVSESYNVPTWMLKPMYSFYITTPYGQKYLSFVQPYLVNIVSIYGGTNP